MLSVSSTITCGTSTQDSIIVVVSNIINSFTLNSSSAEDITHANINLNVTSDGDRRIVRLQDGTVYSFSNGAEMIHCTTGEKKWRMCYAIYILSVYSPFSGRVGPIYELKIYRLPQV